MSKYIGRQIEVGFGIEGTRGTPATIQHWWDKTDFSFVEKAEYINDSSSRGKITDAVDTVKVKQMGEWALTQVVKVNQIGYLLLSLMGTVTTTTDSAWAYLHTFDVNNTNQSQSLTMGIVDPVNGDRSFPLTAIDTLTLNVEEWQYATITVSVKAQPWQSASHTATYSTDYALLARRWVFKIASNLAWLDAASPNCFKSFEVTFEKTLYDDYCAGNLSPIDYINQSFVVSWSFTAMFDSTTYHDYHLDGTKRAIRFELEDTDTTIGASSNPRLTFNFALCGFTEFDMTQGNDEVVQQTLTFKPLESQADWEMVNVELVNTKQEYTA